MITVQRSSKLGYSWVSFARVVREFRRRPGNLFVGNFEQEEVIKVWFSLAVYGQTRTLCLTNKSNGSGRCFSCFRRLFTFACWLQTRQFFTKKTHNSGLR